MIEKPREVVESQIAAFAAQEIANDWDRMYVLGHLSELATGEVGDLVRITEEPEYHEETHEDLPPGTYRFVASGDQYVGFLQTAGGARNEMIQGRADLLLAYERFAPLVRELRASIGPGNGNRAGHDSYFASGENSTIHTLTYEGKTYLVRIPYCDEIDPLAIDRHMGGAVLGRGIPHMEQIVAGSYKDGMTIAEPLPGVPLSRLSIKDIRQTTKAQLGELADTVITATRRGIELDFSGTNFIYDPEAGYGITDYTDAREASINAQQHALSDVVAWVAEQLAIAGIPTSDSEDYLWEYEKTPADRARERAIRTVNLDNAAYFRARVAQRLAGEEREAALIAIDETLMTAWNGMKQPADR